MVGTRQMPRSDKKSRSREAFAAAFEEQTRRFSPFELLGISSDTVPPTPLPSPAKTPPAEGFTQDIEGQAKELVQTLGPDSGAPILRPDSQTEVENPVHHPDPLSFRKPRYSQNRAGQSQTPQPNKKRQILGTDRLSLGQTVDPKQE